MDYRSFERVIKTECQHHDGVGAFFQQEDHGYFRADVWLRRTSFTGTRTARISTNGVEVFLLDLEDYLVRDFEPDPIAQVQVLKDFCAMSLVWLLETEKPMVRRSLLGRRKVYLAFDFDGREYWSS